MTTTITVRHNFETGHRLPQLGGKCENLHGHSWWVEVTVEAPDTPATVVEFGQFKKGLRDWIDTHLDHGVMLGHRDPLADILPHHGKTFLFAGGDGLTAGIYWPTVENVAVLLSRVAGQVLADTDHAPGATVTGVKVSETHVNAAGWTA